MEILRDSSPRDPAWDMALTGAILDHVAARTRPAILRVFLPGPTVAFGRRDSFAEGFQRAARAAEQCGFAPVIRHAGGHAVAYDQSSVIVEWIRPEEHLLGGIGERFEELTTLILDALKQLGVAVELGELPDEYCAGRFSLHLFDGPKIVGVAQRVIKGASLTTAVIAVASGDRLRAVTDRIYHELAIPLDVSTVGAIADRFPDVDVSAVANTIAERGVRLLGSAGKARDTAA